LPKKNISGTFGQHFFSPKIINNDEIELTIAEKDVLKTLMK
jgi:hypothetical protein